MHFWFKSGRRSRTGPGHVFIGPGPVFGLAYYLLAFLDHSRLDGCHGDARCVLHMQPHRRRPQVLRGLVPRLTLEAVVIVLLRGRERDDREGLKELRVRHPARLVSRVVDQVPVLVEPVELETTNYFVNINRLRKALNCEFSVTRLSEKLPLWQNLKVFEGIYFGKFSLLKIAKY